MLFQLEIPTPINQPVQLPLLKEKGIELWIKREDSIHPFVSGNKFRKLKYNIAKAQEEKHSTLLTFGGAYSNHIAATATAGNIAGFKTIGIIRGDELGKDLERTLAGNTTLKHAVDNGMQLKFVSREAYRNKTSEVFIKQLKEEFGSFYLVPEGGTNNLAVQGCQEIVTFEDEKFNYICCAVGTGGTIAGLINSVKEHQKIIGFPALKGDFLTSEIQPFVKRNDHWSLQTNFHFGGYGKYTPELIRFINEFKAATNIPLDPIYTGKMLYGILKLIEENQFDRGSKILAIHTGGLQGVAGVNQKLKNKNQELIQI
ncbi:1-aminocyclopropane-1-carboxylate deaminase [Tenacibaculum sp. 190130A14a]|uniref:1-aminocyclopropane-1-carboxylate deaminase n=1 Tax=Tenacibaculum polynesiense TaxID=3137857 RepID=A0ABP1F4K1_9FLAO